MTMTTQPETTPVTPEMACPKCGEYESIRVTAQIWVDLLFSPSGELEGSDCDNSDHEWGSESAAYCNACDFTGTAGEFYPDKMPPAR